MPPKFRVRGHASAAIVILLISSTLALCWASEKLPPVSPPLPEAIAALRNPRITVIPPGCDDDDRYKKLTERNGSLLFLPRKGTPAAPALMLFGGALIDSRAYAVIAAGVAAAGHPVVLPAFADGLARLDIYRALRDARSVEKYYSGGDQRRGTRQPPGRSWVVAGHSLGKETSMHANIPGLGTRSRDQD